MKLVAAAHKVASGTSRQFAATQHFGRLRSEADIALVFTAEAAGQTPGDRPGAPMSEGASGKAGVVSPERATPPAGRAPSPPYGE